MASTKRLGEVDKGMNLCSEKFKGEGEEEEDAEEKETKTYSCGFLTLPLFVERREKDELIKGGKDDEERGMRMHTNGLHFKEREMNSTEKCPTRALTGSRLDAQGRLKSQL